MTDAPAPFPAFPGAPLGARQSVAPDAQTEALRRAASEFEAMFLSEMLAPMFENLDTDGLGGGGIGEQMFRPMLIENYAAALARAGGVGLADSIVGEFARMQGAAAHGETPGGAYGIDR